MAVEKLTIIEGPMSGMGQNPGPIESTADWLRGYGVSPGIVALSALAGAALTRGPMVAGAIKWSLLGALGSWLYNRCR